MDPLKAIYQVLPRLLDAADSSALTIATAFSSDGNTLLNLLTVIVIVWASIKTLLQNGELTDAIGELVHVLMTWGLAAWILRDYRDITAALLSSFDAVAGRIVELDAAFKSLPTDVQSDPLFQQSPAGGKALYVGLSGLFGATSRILDGMLGILSTSPMDAVLEWPTTLTTVLVLGASWLVLVFCAATYTVIYASSNLLLAIGLALGPLFIPWFVFQPTRSLFDGWLRFLIQGGLYKVVAAVLITMVGPMVTALANFVTEIYSNGSTNPFINEVVAGRNAALIGGSTFIFLMSILVAALLLQAPSIASALAGGRLDIAARMPVPRGASVPSRSPKPA